MSVDYAKQQEQLDKKIESSKAGLNTATSGHADTPVWSNTNAATMSALVLLFGVIICCLVMALLKQGRHADSVLRVVGTILIIISSIFLVVAGYTDTQIAPVMGLLGTIAGYLLGKNADGTPKDKDLKSESGEKGQ